jgi:uncharacterized membrane-anchored protein YhcB (DUF1043 family)
MNPFLPYAVAALLIGWIGTGWYAYTKGHEAAENEARVHFQKTLIDSYQKQIKAVEKAAEINGAAAEAWEQQARENEKVLEHAQESIQELIDELEKSPPPPECLYTPADIERLRRKAGTPRGHGQPGTAPNAGNVSAGQGAVSKGR